MMSRTATSLVWVLVAFTAIVLQATTMKAQTTISNETLVTTTFVVNETSVTASCKKGGCTASSPMLQSIAVTCPAATGKTCTLHLELQAKVATSFPGPKGNAGAGPAAFYQFSVDGAPPTPGPTDAKGNYLFGKSVSTAAEGNKAGLFSRQNYPASVVATVTNTSSSNHTIDVNLVCQAENQETGCAAQGGWATLRVDVFEP